MADTKISAGADPGTLTATDKLPLARSASTTAYAATMAEIASYANTAYTPNYSAAAPIMDGTAAPGVAAAVSRGDHIHPSDLTRAPLASPTFTGTSAAPTPTTDDNTTRITTTAFVQAQMVASGAGVSTWNTRAGAVVLQQADIAAVGALHDDGRNLIDNGCFNVAQRGAGSFTVSGGYTADRWLMAFANGSASVGVGAASDANRASVGDEAFQYFLYNNFTGSATGGSFCQLWQRIENVRRLAGKTVTVSFYAATGTAGFKLGVVMANNYGTGGSPSAPDYTASQSVTLTTAWGPRYSLTFTVPSASGKTFGTTAGTDYTLLSFEYSNPSGVGVQSGNITLWGVQLEIGSVATPLDYGGKPQQQLAACQRFYQTGNVGVWGNGAAGSWIGAHRPFVVRMRAVPTLSFSNPVLSNCSGMTAYGVGQDDMIPYAVVTATGATSYFSNFTASADL